MAKPTIRSGQLINPFGVGALCEVDGQSFFVRGTGSWQTGRNLHTIDLPALTDRMRPGTLLRQPMFSVGVTRFPRWHFCPSCRAMVKWTVAMDHRQQDTDPLPKPTCPNAACRGHRLVPMRFVAVCDGGHLDEIDWYRWAHRRHQQSEQGSCSHQTAQLWFRVTGESGGDFSSMSIECSCGATSTLEGISDGPLPWRCSGYQPGEQLVPCVDPADSQGRGRLLFMEPRGSSALHYAWVISALDLSSEPANESILTEEPRFRSLLEAAAKIPVGSGVDILGVFGSQVVAIGQELGVDEEAAWDTFVHELEKLRGDSVLQGSNDSEVTQGDILFDEFPVLASPSGVQGRYLVTKPAPAPTKYQLDRLFQKIVQVEQLREVRAFRGFQRRKPLDENPVVPPSLGRASPVWLPATQVLGEGIFLEFSPCALRNWLNANQDAIDAFASQQLNAAHERGLPLRMGFNANAVFIMVHTFAHLLVNQLAFDCGYSSTSLRERIYCGTSADLFAGILIYTADSDAEGSMGGLVEMGSPERLAEVVYRAVARSVWCSGDPVCRELDAQGIEGMNRSACHACSLVAETSCTFSNILLNRVLIAGSGEPNGKGVVEPVGFFRPVLDTRDAISQAV